MTFHRFTPICVLPGIEPGGTRVEGGEPLIANCHPLGDRAWHVSVEHGVVHHRVDKFGQRAVVQIPTSTFGAESRSPVTSGDVVGPYGAIASRVGQAFL